MSAFDPKRTCGAKARRSAFEGLVKLPRSMHDLSIGARPMFEALKKRGWRGAVGLITSYAFVLQAFLAYSVASQAAVHGDSSGAFFVICISDDTGARVDVPGAPVQSTTHCPICTLTASASLITPDLVELPIRQPTSERYAPFISAQACLRFHQSRSGLSRAPPLHV